MDRATGFAAPTQGYEEKGIDFNRLLVHNPPATYTVRLESADMESLGLARGSFLIVDRSKKPAVNSFVLITHEGKFLCRLLKKKGNKTVFTNGKEEISPIPGETQIFGKVTASITIFEESHDIPY
jgi:DNA polymerase V